MACMSIIRIDSDAVASASSGASASIARIQQEVQVLHAQLTNLQSSWQGPAASAFQGVVTSWHGTQQRVEADLTALTQALARTATHYADLEAATMRVFGG